MSAIEDGAMQDKDGAQVDDIVKRLHDEAKRWTFGYILTDAANSIAAERTRLRERNAELEKEITSLRTIVSKCADALGNGAVISQDCSIAFMGELPSEIGLHVASLAEDRDTWKEQSDHLRAEVERLEKELKLAKSAAENYDKDCIDIRYQRDLIEADRDSLRAKLEKAREALEPFDRMAASWVPGADERDEDTFPTYNLTVHDLRRARSVLAELSADAPAQQTQISDEVREAMVEDEKALEPMAVAGTKLRKLVGDEDISDWAMNYRGFKVSDFDAAVTALAKLRSIRT